MEKYMIGGVHALELTEKYGSPIYVYDTETIKRKFFLLKKAFSKIPHRIHYAVKANEAPEILMLMKDLGAGLDTVSPNEIRRALKLGFKVTDIIFTPSCPAINEIKFALENGIRIHFGESEYFEELGDLLKGVEVGLRINPDVHIEGNQKIATAHADSKFGIPLNQLPAVKQMEEKFGFKVVTLHIHTGSDVKTWQDLAKSFDSLLLQLPAFNNVNSLDIGSGLKVKYNATDHEIDLDAYTKYIKDKLENLGKSINIILEPGKFLVAEAGTLLASVNVIKQGYNKRFVGLNTGSNHLIRPMYYEAYHHIINISNMDGKMHIYDVVGQLCEEDTLASERALCEVRAGDILAIQNTGAYGYSMASFYNLRDKPRQILVENSAHRLISEDMVVI
ncbi:MAG TPA: diaminopimelate decarboxylase [Saprospiraceae bacterium]|nr:diaminopimelate decarboxylase [Saprospirales bacterium]HRQ30663.1 diaminopimelate decarboxylase [Saprospiraceae bacterium]